MACGSCSKRQGVSRDGGSESLHYDLTGGVNINSLNNQQIRARLEVYKRKFCLGCSRRYECDYTSYLVCQQNKK